MKHFTSISARSMAFAFALVMFASSFAFAAINPIPGVDIIVKKKPGNIAIHATTDSTGKFSINKLTPGTYTLTYSKLPKMASRYRPTLMLMPRPPYCIISVNGEIWDSAKPVPLTEGLTIGITIGENGNYFSGTITASARTPINITTPISR